MEEMSQADRDYIDPPPIRGSLVDTNELFNRWTDDGGKVVGYEYDGRIKLLVKLKSGRLVYRDAEDQVVHDTDPTATEKA
jgi:hypothetical protein